MRCIYDRNTFCVINPDGPMTKDFVCLECHKPGKESGDKDTEKRKINQGVFDARGKNRGFRPKKRGLGRGRGRGRRK